MKKILPWLIGLIVLIFLCLWTKLDSIYSSMNGSDKNEVVKHKIVQEPQVIQEQEKKQEQNMQQKLAEKRKAEQELAQKRKLQQELAQKHRAELFLSLKNINNLQYDVNKAELTDDMKTNIDNISDKIIGCDNYIIKIFGHTDSDGSQESNQILGQKRADAVKMRFISNNIDEKHLVAKSFGELNPIVPNTSDENKKLNRRVEIKIIGE